MHADATGILTLLTRADPRHVALVHGEWGQMSFLQQYIRTHLHKPCWSPKTNTTMHVKRKQHVLGYLGARLAADVYRYGIRGNVRCAHVLMCVKQGPVVHGDLLLGQLRSTCLLAVFQRRVTLRCILSTCVCIG